MVRRSSRNSTGTRDASHSFVVQPCSVRPAAIAGVTDRRVCGDPASRVGSGVGNRARQLLCGITTWSDANDNHRWFSHHVRSVENPFVRRVKRR